jgi:hypothetical protein
MNQVHKKFEFDFHGSRPQNPPQVVGRTVRALFPSSQRAEHQALRRAGLPCSSFARVLRVTGTGGLQYSQPVSAAVFFQLECPIPSFGEQKYGQACIT